MPNQETVTELANVRNPSGIYPGEGLLMYGKGQNTLSNAKVKPIIFSTMSDVSARYNKAKLPSQYANQPDDKIGLPSRLNTRALYSKRTFEWLEKLEKS